MNTLHNSRSVRSALAGILLASALLLQGCQDDLTKANYDQVKVGQQQWEVEKLLGGAGEKQDVAGMSVSGAGIASSSNSGTQSTFLWKAKGKEISVTFRDGKVIDKLSRGLE